MATDVNGVVLGVAPSGVAHLAIPMVLGGDGSLATVEQDSATEIVQSVAMLVGTRPGTRFQVPAYGIPDPTFEGISQGSLGQAVGRWEPRAQVAVITSPSGVEQVAVTPLGGATQ